MIWLDAAGIDDNEDYGWGWCHKGPRFLALKPGHRRQRVSLIAALRQRELSAPMTFEGYCDRTVFTAWLEQELVPHLQPGDTVILDNPSFHKSTVITAAVARTGAPLLYLPPYSPDLNRIEPCGAPLKNTIRKNIPRFPTFRQAADAAFLATS